MALGGNLGNPGRTESGCAVKTICPECHHAPSGRTFACGCRCHDVADASPELLEACKEAASFLGSNVRVESEWSGRVEYLLAHAIAKAEGGAK